MNEIYQAQKAKEIIESFFEYDLGEGKFCYFCKSTKHKIRCPGLFVKDLLEKFINSIREESK